MVPGCTFSSFSEDTTFQMIPTQRRTVMMMQNLNIGFYNNIAGVLFTMPVSEEIKNVYLQQSASVPSDPNLYSGQLTQ
jgi:hypothetical protein